MPTCSFCKKNFEAPRGLTVFTFEGKTIYFCSTKCRRNMNLKRDPKKVNWVKREKVKKSEKVVEVKKKDEGENVEIKEKENSKKKVEDKKE